MKNTTSIQISQHKTQKTILDIRILSASLQFFNDALTIKQRSILSVILAFYIKCPQIFPSYETIAERAGCCPKTVQRAMKYFEHMGLIVREQRNRGWLYKVSSWFKSFEVRRRLAVIFPVLAIGLPTLIAASKLASDQAIEKNVHLKNNISKDYSTRNRNLYINNPLPILPNLVNKERVGVGLKKEAKKRVVMEAEFSKIIDKLPFVPTLYGKIKLSWIPDDILQTMSDNLSYPNDVKDPAKYLFKAACIQLEKLGRAKDSQRYYALGLKHGSFDEKTSFTEPGDYTGLGKKGVKKEKGVALPLTPAQRLARTQEEGKKIAEKLVVEQVTADKAARNFVTQVKIAEQSQDVFFGYVPNAPYGDYQETPYMSKNCLFSALAIRSLKELQEHNLSWEEVLQNNNLSHMIEKVRHALPIERPIQEKKPTNNSSLSGAKHVEVYLQHILNSQK